MPCMDSVPFDESIAAFCSSGISKRWSESERQFRGTVRSPIALYERLFLRLLLSALRAGEMYTFLSSPFPNV